MTWVQNRKKTSQSIIVYAIRRFTWFSKSFVLQKALKHNKMATNIFTMYSNSEIVWSMNLLDGDNATFGVIRLMKTEFRELCRKQINLTV